MFNPFMPSGFLYFNSLDSFISYIWGVWLVFSITIFAGISELRANSVDPDQILIWVYTVCQFPFMALGFYDTGLKWVNA